jgi:hypothetical protein
MTADDLKPWHDKPDPFSEEQDFRAMTDHQEYGYERLQMSLGRHESYPPVPPKREGEHFLDWFRRVCVPVAGLRPEPPRSP